MLFFLSLLLLLLSFRWVLLVAVFVLHSLPRRSSGAPLSVGVLCVYSSMLCCLIGVLYCGGFFMRCCSLPLCLIGCLASPWVVVVWVGVEVLVVYVCGVCQNDSIVGWSANRGVFALGRSRYRWVLVFVLGLVSLSLSLALSTVRAPPPPVPLIGLLELFCRM